MINTVNGLFIIILLLNKEDTYLYFEMCYDLKELNYYFNKN